MEPIYLNLIKNGQLAERAAQAYEQLTNCTCCGWKCQIDRRMKLGSCQTGMKARLASYGPHLGEEAPLRGWHGSGTIFFASCNMHCQYCQNSGISQDGSGEEIEPKGLAAIMLELQDMGCHNINLVSPTHVIAPILAAIVLAAQAGLRLPLVYNTGGYDSLTTLRLLDGVIDIYMPDMKYADEKTGLRYSQVRHYPQVNQVAVKEMYRQVGDLEIDEQGIARHGLLVRHLVLPHELAGTKEIVHFLSKKISPNTYLNLMAQYHPAWRAYKYSQLSKRTTSEEYQRAIELALQAGLTRLDKQDSKELF